MTALLYKQTKLVSHVMTFVFIISGVMLLIPNYPYSVIFFYVTLGLFFMFANGREQRDIDFSALLPIRKRDLVKCSVVFSAGIEVASIVFAIPFAFISDSINPNGSNAAGIDANVAIFGVAFLLFAVFNVIFLLAFYRSGYKIGVAFIKAGIGMFIVCGIDVFIPHLLPWIDGHDSRQFIVLFIGILAFVVATLFAYKKSASLYEKVDL